MYQTQSSFSLRSFLSIVSSISFNSFGCRCAAYPANSEAEAELNAETQKYRDILVDLVNTGRYDTRDDFTAVIQPFFSKTTLPKKVCTNLHQLIYKAFDLNFSNWFTKCINNCFYMFKCICK